ncbi:MAG TPA: acyl-CoA dehydrogenase family protein [Candidatus Dormibacteraeota bacterium]|nr:acyl-CoA dehydrogenase family protein [Candidatus Dormibacteraeota bacterium]
MDFALSPALLQARDRARAAAEELLAPAARTADAEARFDRGLVQELGRRGLLDERDPALARCLIAEELGRVDSSVRGLATVQVALVAGCLAEWGSPAQRARWLPWLRSGEAIGCYALTEPEAGSDVRSLQTRAMRVPGGWRLEGEKHWITNGGVAEVALVFASAEEGVTAFVVPTDAPGLERRPMPGEPLGHRAADHAVLTLRGLELGEDAVLGRPGGGLQVAMSALRRGRLEVAAGAVGVLQACLDASVDFARRRRQFGRRIGDFQMVQAALADMAADLAAARLLVREAAWLEDAGRGSLDRVAVAKLFCTEAALRAADQAILIHGGRGYSNLYPVERYWRDAKGMQIYEGTAHVQRLIIARALLGRDEGASAAVRPPGPG